MKDIVKNLVVDNKFYTTKVRDLYLQMDLGHDEKHFDEVYNEAWRLGFFDFIAGLITIDDVRIIMAAAAYHDIGRVISNKNHEQIAVDAIMNFDSDNKDSIFYDVVKYLYDNFTDENIKFICEIISQHRSKAKATSELAAIVKDADKIGRTDMNRFLYRLVGYNIEKIIDDNVCLMTDKMIPIINNYIKEHEKDPERNTSIFNSMASRYLNKDKKAIKLQEVPDVFMLDAIISNVYQDYCAKNKVNK